MDYFHVDVFSNKPYSGNGLTIFIGTKDLDKGFMQLVTQEMRQFESIFLKQINENTFRAYIFTMEEELDFAGHPLIGAAAILHDLFTKSVAKSNWIIELNEKSVAIETIKYDTYYSAQMNQGKAEFGTILSTQQEIEFLSYFNLTKEDKVDGMPFQVITTGLPYLIMPIKSASLAKAKITIPDLEEKLKAINAKFLYVLDIENLEGRTWDNLGLYEDVATGSAAGPVGAYLHKNNLLELETEMVLNQGRFLGRPSTIKIRISKTGEIFVEGDVCKIAFGQLLQEK
ncbi:PhzF family phenazine biosynthesis protein [Flavobacterium soyangense]|uniref:PhzF family phenazine biosynthesis protein n=1 Tax=Flavobacterium soyangense TaxID=2023265 RepID=A0A930Y1V7_9FLAO|nr:PhzF family phenazine biosynthesis protein [Flavobacterium soyangense]MBF2709864.1 PhzF family phenazine biosynthesis protein [Flavobacterium soyangense]